MSEGFSPEELAKDSDAVVTLRNAAVTLDSVDDNDNLTDRERARLSTIQQKVSELESIITERKAKELREGPDTEGGQ